MNVAPLGTSNLCLGLARMDLSPLLTGTSFLLLLGVWRGCLWPVAGTERMWLLKLRALLRSRDIRNGKLQPVFESIHNVECLPAPHQADRQNGKPVTRRPNFSRYISAFSHAFRSSSYQHNRTSPHPMRSVENVNPPATTSPVVFQTRSSTEAPLDKDPIPSHDTDSDVSGKLILIKCMLMYANFLVQVMN